MTFKDMLSNMYKPFQGLAPEHSRLMNNISGPGESLVGGNSKFMNPFTADMSSVQPGFSGYPGFNPANKSS